MKNIFKKILGIGLIIFLLLQLYQPARNVAFEQDLTADFSKAYHVPSKVETILRNSCYDCHSNNTNYPWYSNIQPVRFFLENHIQNGKKDLNFDEFGTYSKRKQNSKLKAISKQIKLNEMPLRSYTLIHKNAMLSTGQKQEVINWINSLKDN
ncbi:heme-binding domain-containing protein [Flavobacterium gilvum]|uniref:Cytochrome C n=1 Tax=Flavobacterium gilvum TaxID=1492737 RepID=A0AAC9I4X6_9FLAO|nr:heme-binding domain-containing protein [Flavobacterium gilvum]AOW08943.1 cytochrome C [Flavobacterium gilvum]KFC60901.1 cytochrome C [Flavobacterium gilvum]